MKYSVVVPCYNEEKNIEPLVQEFNNLASHYDFELILVDNGSKDHTSFEIDKQMKNHDYIKKVTVDVNQGYGYGILSGLKKSTGDCVGWIHADLQSKPSVFENMFISAEEDSQTLFLYKGERTNRSIGESFFTTCMGIFESILFKVKLYDCNSQPTLLSKDFFESWQNPPKDFSLDLYVYALAVKKNILIKRFNSPQQRRLNGESTWNTQWNSRFKMIRRVILYSFAVKRNLEGK